ncbi:MAG: hypothetical protein IJM59_00055 [Proteobacteria bacterium]|nr:hypothetical protein [Pseudomonadota bacterium]
MYEDLTEKGGRLNPCKNIEAIVFEDGRQCHTESECPEFKNAFTYKMCPRDYPQCFEDKICRQRVEIVESDCSPNEIRCAKGEGDEFECIDPGNLNTCGAIEADCANVKRGVDCSADIVKKDGEKTYDCFSTGDSYECKLMQCEEGYHYNSTDRSCVKIDIHNCASIGNDCTQLDGFSKNEENVGCSENHVCIAKNECVDGYYLDGTNCLKYTKIVCGKERKDCTAIPGWDDGDCKNGACVITKCRDGFELKNGECHLIVSSGCAEEEKCDGSCVNLKSDNLHCGDCSTQCRDDQVCFDGQCVCISGYEACQTEEGMKCVSVKTTKRCGSCEHSCVGDRVICSEGECKCDGEGLTLCKDVGCFDLKSSNEHCGECNHKCNTVDGGAEICKDGVCVLECLVGYHLHKPLFSSSTYCAKDDNYNCGSQGKMCGAGLGIKEHCVDGECVKK